MQVSIIIVNYNTKDLLRDCLKTIISYTQEIEYEIIVSDNGSSDDSVEMLKKEFSSVIVLENNKNLGFGTANNKALEIASGKYVLYLNSDTVLCNNAVKDFFDYMEAHINENIGAIGTNLMDNKKNIIHSFGRFPSFLSLTKILIRDNISQFLKLILHMLCIKKEHFTNSTSEAAFYTGNVDYITGADLFLKNDENAKFDEKFFLYYEETDLQKTMSKKGLERRIIDGPQIIHLEGGSNTNGKKFTSFGNLISYISMVYYCKKNISKSGAILLKILILLLWLNPLHLKNTKKFFRKLFEI